MSKPVKELKISAIREGTVIDHIPSDAVFKVVEILNLEQTDEIVSVATNLPSPTAGKKGIIKIGGAGLSEEEVNKIAIIAPEATLNRIEDYKVVEKTSLKIPDEITKVIRCFNPKCITNSDDMDTIFYAASKDPLKVRCHYCEKSMEKDEIVLK